MITAMATSRSPVRQMVMNSSVVHVVVSVVVIAEKRALRSSPWERLLSGRPPGNRRSRKMCEPLGVHLYVHEMEGKLTRYADGEDLNIAGLPALR